MSNHDEKYETHQYDLFGSVKNDTNPHQAASKSSEKKITPPSLHNGLDMHNVRDHAMLWMRMMTKGTRQNSRMFLYHQFQEICFKRTEYDPVLSVRQSLVKAFVKA